MQIDTNEVGYLKESLNARKGPRSLSLAGKKLTLLSYMSV